MGTRGSDPWSRRLLLRTSLCTIALLASAALPSCGKNDSPAKQTLGVVATTGMIADVAREIAGPNATVTALMGEGVDPHLYKPSPGDVRTMSDAAMILFNGLHLEGRMADVIVKMASGREVIQVTDTIDESLLREPPEFEGQFDPHVWFDVSLWRTASQRITSALAAKDPANATAYKARGDDYAAVLDALHEYARTTIATIPESNRVLVTAHDAFGYFGRAYGLNVLAIQGISTDSEASLRDMNALVDVLAKNRIPAVFVESSVPRKTVDALVEGCRARDHSIIIGGELFSDAMGADGTLSGTYVGMVVHNVDTITHALGGTVPQNKPGKLGEYLQRLSASQAKAPS